MKREDYSYEQFLDKKFSPSVYKYTVVNQALMHLTGEKTKDCSQDISHVLWSAESAFVYKTHCLFCRTKYLYHGDKADCKLVPVRIYDFENKVLESCRNRQDHWSLKVQARVEFVSDLPASDAVYHQTCSANFRTGKQVPIKYTHDDSTAKMLRRPYDSTQTHALKKVILYLEPNDEEQITINDLIQKREENLIGTGSTAYSFTHMKDQLKKQFAENNIIADINGSLNVITQWSTASTILNDFYAHPKQESPELEKVMILEAVAKIYQK